ncbi:MAG: hypothetical protein GXY83_32330 [Rhodopirellula sp.]|nr:hypothetical protein [Rhodopirellula sp.]
MHDIAFGDHSLVTVESGEDPLIGDVDPPFADFGCGDCRTGRDGLLPEEIPQRHDADVRHGGQGIEQGAAAAIAAAHEPESQDIGPRGMDVLWCSQKRRAGCGAEFEEVAAR